MAITITRDNRKAFTGQLEAMFRDRKRVFIDHLGWDLPVIAGDLEIDQFDDDNALYFAILDPLSGRHMASVRLLPTTRPHLMDTVFSALCESGAPRGEHIYEMSRLCADPDLPAETASLARAQLLLALIDYCLANGIRELTAVCEIKFLSKLLAVGWDCRPLGPPQMIGADLCGALAVEVTPATLEALHERFGIRRAA